MTKRQKRKGPAVTDYPVMRVLAEAKAEEWLKTQGAKEFSMLLMGALVAAYRLGRYGVMDGDSLSPHEQADSLDSMKPIMLAMMMRINDMGKQFNVE